MTTFEATRCASQVDAAQEFRQLLFDYLNQEQSKLWGEVESSNRQSRADAGAQIRMIADIKLFLCKLEIK